MGHSSLDAVRNRRLRTLSALVIVLSLIVLSPSIRLGVQKLLRRNPIQLQSVEISISGNWMISHNSTKISAWRPCATILCGWSPLANFAIEITDAPEETWEQAARKVIRGNYSRDAEAKTINTGSGRLKCLELDPATSGSAVVSCFNSNLHFYATFDGDPSLELGFYDALQSAREAPR